MGIAHPTFSATPAISRAGAFASASSAVPAATGRLPAARPAHWPRERAGSMRRLQAPTGLLHRVLSARESRSFLGFRLAQHLRNFGRSVGRLPGLPKLAHHFGQAYPSTYSSALAFVRLSDVLLAGNIAHCGLYTTSSLAHRVQRQTCASARGHRSRSARRGNSLRAKDWPLFLLRARIDE